MKISPYVQRLTAAVVLLTLQFNANALVRLEQNRPYDVFEIPLRVQAILRSTGQAVTSLTYQDIIVLEDGVKQKIKTFKRVPLPICLILVVDMNGTDHERAFVRSQLKLWRSNIASFLKAEDRVAFVIISDEVRMIDGLLNDSQKIADAIDQISNYRYSTRALDKDLESSIQLGLGAMNKGIRFSTSQAVILISARSQAIAKSDFVFSHKLGDEFLARGILFNWNSTRKDSLAVDKKKRSLQRTRPLDLITSTGGALFQNDWPNFIDRLRTPYIVYVTPEKFPLSEGEFREVEIHLGPNVKNRDDLRLSYSRAYVFREEFNIRMQVDDE